MKIIILSLLITGVFADEIIPKADYSAGSEIKASEINNSIKATSGFLKDDDLNPTVCMKLKLKAGLHQFLYVPVDCVTGVESGVVQDGLGVYQIGSGGGMLSCLDYYNNYPSQRTLNGKYIIDADGVGSQFSAHTVYCDMENGGYTLVSVISGANQNHQSSSSVSINNIADRNYGKVSDLEINQIVTNSFKLTCSGSTVYKSELCNFSSDSFDGGDCYDTSDNDSRGIVVPNVYYGHTTTVGCHNSSWNNDGELWAK